MIGIIFYIFSAMLLASGVMVISSRNSVYSVLFLIYAFFNAAGLFVILGAEFLAMILVIVYVGAVAVLFLFVVMMMDINWQQKVKNTFSPHTKLFWRSTFLLLGYSFIFLVVFMVCTGGITYFLGYLFEDIPHGIVGDSLSLLISNPETLSILPIWSLISDLFQDNPFGLTSLLIAASILISFFLARSVAHLVIRDSFFTAIKLLVKNFPGAWFLACIFGAQLVLISIFWHDSSVTKTLMGTPLLISEPTMPNTQALGQIIYTDYLYIFQLSGIVLLVAMIGAIVLTSRKRNDVKRQSIKSQIQRQKENSITLKDVPLGKGVIKDA